MKWPAKQVAIMLSGFEQYLDKYEYSAEDIRNEYRDDPMWPVWMIAMAVTYDLQYDNSHPAYQPGEIDGVARPARERKVDHNPEFVLYPDGCNDNHRKTMLKHVAKNVGLI